MTQEDQSSTQICGLKVSLDRAAKASAPQIAASRGWTLIICTCAAVSSRARASFAAASRSSSAARLARARSKKSICRACHSHRCSSCWIDSTAATTLASPLLPAIRRRALSRAGVPGNSQATPDHKNKWTLLKGGVCLRRSRHLPHPPISVQSRHRQPSPPWPVPRRRQTRRAGVPRPQASPRMTNTQSARLVRLHLRLRRARVRTKPRAGRHLERKPQASAPRRHHRPATLSLPTHQPWNGQSSPGSVAIRRAAAKTTVPTRAPS